MCGLLQDLQGMFKLSAEEKRLQLEFIWPSDLPRYIYSDQSKLRQVLINLLNNSIKFTTDGQIVVFAQNYVPKTTHEDAAESDKSLTHGPEQPRLLRFVVTDMGPGISPAELESVFDPFTQSQSGRESQEGTGLGLSICQKFVQLMGGQIEINNRMDGHTGLVVSFTVQVQESGESVVSDDTPTQRVIAIASNQPRYKILVVDDKVANQQLMTRLLEPLALDVKVVSDGQAAVETVQQWQPALIWMDLRMPVMDGVEATKQIQAYAQSLAGPSVSEESSEEVYEPKIVALSATSFSEDRSRAIAAGCDTFIAKPFTADQIYDCMAQQLGIRYLYDAGVISTEIGAISDPDSQAYDPISDLPQLLDQSAFSQVSPQLAADLEAAVLRLQWDKILQVIQDISAQDEALADTLNHTVHNFQYERILAAIGDRQSQAPV